MTPRTGCRVGLRSPGGRIIRVDNKPAIFLKRELSLDRDVNSLYFLDINMNSFGVRDSRRERVDLEDKRDLYFLKVFIFEKEIS